MDDFYNWLNQREELSEYVISRYDEGNRYWVYLIPGRGTQWNRNVQRARRFSFQDAFRMKYATHNDWTIRKLKPTSVHRPYQLTQIPEDERPPGELQPYFVA